MTAWSPASTLRGVGAIAVALAALLGVLVIGAAGDDATAPASGVNPARIPPLARTMLPLITQLVSNNCPELPPLWVVAEIQAESSWNPRAFSADSNGGAAGLYQINQQNWVAAGGRPWRSSPPPADADVFDPTTQLRIGIPWVCANLRAAADHLAATGKSTTPLDAMLICHIAGCGRVSGSASGTPRPGEASCSARCARLITDYLTTVHSHVAAYTAPAGTPGSPQRVPAAGLPAAPPAYLGPITGCTQPDPTTRGCLTATARNGLEAAATAFNGWRDGPVIRSTGCWDAHAWNPTSDHAKGKACDFFPGRPGRFASGPALADGWQLAEWFRGNAARLHVRYIIWQGRYWDPSSDDRDGWGTRYNGGGIYNVGDATGGHYDHVHVSFTD